MSRSLSHFFGDNVLLGSRTRKPVKQFEIAEEPKKTTKNNTNAKKKNGGNKENKNPNSDDDSYFSDEESYEEPVAKKSGRRSDGPKRVPKKSMKYVPDSEDDESDGMDSIESEEPEQSGSGENGEGEEESEEETVKIDAILGYKPSKEGKPADDQFLIKFQGESYLHVKWLSTAEVEEYPAGKQRIKRYLAKRKQMEENGELDEDEEYFDPNFAIIERVIAVDYFDDEDEKSGEEKENGEEKVDKMDIANEDSEEKDDEKKQKEKAEPQKKGGNKNASASEKDESEEKSGPLDLVSEESQESEKPAGKKHYFVKFKGLQYDEATWEDAEMVEREYPELVEEFNKRVKLPTKELQQNSKKGAVRRNTKDFKEDMEQVKFENDITLREYQLEGLRWLVWNWCCGRSGILADEMGLGKTVQALSVLWWLRITKKMRGPFLIICPLATIDHWLHHVNSLTSLNAIVWHGTQTSRDLIHDNEFYFDGLSKTMAKTNNVYKFEVILTTFEVLLQDVELLSKPFWKYLVIDEAHRLKNKQSRLFEILQNFRSEHRLLLTGTPLQNNIDELWTMLNFIDPDEFSSFQDFSKKYGALQTSKQVQKLQKELSPYLLRRMKNDVEKSIPSKEETIVDVELTYTQKTFYRAVLEKNRNFLSMGASSKSNVPSLSNIMMELRKVCNHPYLVAAAEETITRGVKSDKEHKEWLVKSSAKLVFLDKLLPKLQAEGHKVLIFSQMVRMLDLLEDYMNYKSFKFERIDGSMDRQSRAQSLTRFKTLPDRYVMLLSTKACSLGIDLTVADTVILFDSDWNPHSDLQAQARSHRIGQKNKVKVFRLVTRNTYESQMFQVASRKLGLNRAVLGNSEFGGKNDSKPDAFLDAKDIERLLKVGAYDLFKADAESEKKLQDEMINEDIETILSRSKTVTVDENGGNSNQGELFASFSKASFVASNKDMDVDMDDQDFWEKILPEFKDAASLLKKLKKGELTSPESKDAFLNDIENLIKSVKEAARHRSQFSSQNPATEVADLLIKSEISGVFNDAQVTRIIMLREELEGKRARKKDGKAGGDAMEVDDGDGEKKAKAKPAPKASGSEWTKKSFQELRKALLLYPFGEWESIINQSKDLSKNFSLEDIQCYSEHVASYVCSPDQLANCERERVEDKESKDEKGSDSKAAPAKKSSKKRSTEEDDHPFLLNYLEYQTKLAEEEAKTVPIPYKAIIKKCTVGKKLNPGQRITLELEWREVEKPSVSIIVINRLPCDYDQQTRTVRRRVLTDPKVTTLTMYAPGYIGSYSVDYEKEKYGDFSVIENRVMSRDFDEQMKQFKTWNRRFNFLLKLQKVFDKYGNNLENLDSFVVPGSAPTFWWSTQQDKQLLQHTRASGFSRYTSLLEELNNIDTEYLNEKIADTLSEKHRMHIQSEELRKVASPNLRVDLPSYNDFIKRDEAKQAVKFEVPPSSVLTTRLTKVVKILSEEKPHGVVGSAMEVVMTVNKKRKIDEVVQGEKAEKENKPKKKQKVNAEDTAGGESKAKKESKSKPKEKKESEEKKPKVKKEEEKGTKKKSDSAPKEKKEKKEKKEAPKKEANGSDKSPSKPKEKKESTKKSKDKADNKKITSFFTKESKKNGETEDQDEKKANGSAEKKKQSSKEKKPKEEKKEKAQAAPLLLVLDESN